MFGGCEHDDFKMHGHKSNQSCMTGRQADLISEDGESFLQGQLEPVAAGYAVPCPIVEVPAQYLFYTSRYCAAIHLSQSGYAAPSSILDAEKGKMEREQEEREEPYSWATTPSTRE